jgi:hypothetical protein
MSADYFVNNFTSPPAVFRAKRKRASERFDCDRCGVNVAYHTAACIAAQINERTT